MERKPEWILNLKAPNKMSFLAHFHSLRWVGLAENRTIQIPNATLRIVFSRFNELTSPTQTVEGISKCSGHWGFLTEWPMPLHEVKGSLQQAEIQTQEIKGCVAPCRASHPSDESGLCPTISSFCGQDGTGRLHGERGLRMCMVFTRVPRKVSM